MTNTKKKKGNKMKLLSAVGMLTVSAAMLVSSTFAWFSMNKKVTAETMTISAKSDSPFLLISDDNSTFDTSVSFTSTATADDALMLTTPLNVASNVQYYADSAAKTAGTKTTPTKFTNAGSVLWGTTFSTDPSEVQETNTTTLVPTADKGKYVLAKELWVKVADNSVTGTNFKLTKATITKGTNAIADAARLLVVTETGTYNLYDAGESATTIAGDAALLPTVTTTAAKITVYFYFDGTDAESYTDNATDLSNVSINMEFEVDNVTAVN